LPIRLLFPIISLLSGVALLVVGMSLLFSAIGAQAGVAKFSTTVTGLINSAYFAGFVLGTYWCPVIIRSVGHIRAFAAMASILSTLPILHVLWTSPWFWGFLRLSTGICLVGLYVVVESWLNVVAKPEYRGKIFASYMAVSGVSSAIGQGLILAGDRLGFFPFALVSILFSFALVPLTLTPVEDPESFPAPKFSWSELFQLSPVGVTAAVASGLLCSAVYSMGTVFGHGVGMSDTGVAIFMVGTILGGALCQWPIGHFSDRHDRCWVLFWVGGMAALVAGAGFYIAKEQEQLLVGVGVVLGGLIFAIYGLSVAHVNDLIDPTKTLEVTGGLLLLYGVGATVGPTLAGGVMDLLGAEGLMVYFAGILTGLTVITWYFTTTRRPSAGTRADHPDFVATVNSSQAMLQIDPRSHRGDAIPSTEPQNSH